LESKPASRNESKEWKGKDKYNGKEGKKEKEKRKKEGKGK
jgi:hypothetical protein